MRSEHLEEWGREVACEGKEPDRTGCMIACPTMIETYTGKFVDSVNLKEQDVDFRDIAHSLSFTCRYGGHVRRFYSVAEHSIHCYDVARRAGYSGVFCLAVLLHDAGEAYWHDLARPLKIAEGMEQYNRYLDSAQRMVEWTAGVLAYGNGNVVHNLAVSSHNLIKEIDNALLKAEARRLMSTKGREWGFLDVVKAAEIPSWKWWWYSRPKRAERGFLRRLRRHGI
jgi:hypothetical protein